MAKKKKKKEEEIFNDDLDMDDFETEEPIQDMEEDLQENDVPMEFDDAPVNPMGLAYHINKESETIKHFKDMPRETRFSFLNQEDKQEVKHHARAYRTWNYIEKIITLRIEEDKIRKDVLKHLELIETREELKDYLKQLKRDYMINIVDDLNDEEISAISNHVKTLKPNYMIETIEKRKLEMTKLYSDYNIVSKTPEYIDDMDNLGKVVDTTILSMGFKGNAASHSVMTINAVKNEDVEKDIEKKSNWSLLDTIKSKFS